MKMHKKIGIGLVLLATLLPSVGIFGSTQKALAATAQPFFNNKVFDGVKYTLKNGEITATLIDASPNGTNTIPLTFTDSVPGDSIHEYVSDKQLFCKSQTDFRDSSPAKITLSGAPSGNPISGQLSAYVLGENASACSDNSQQISITNLDASTGGSGSGLPATLTYNGSTYNLVDPAYSIYGLNPPPVFKGGDCYGGSVIVTNDAGTSGTAYLDLVGTSGVTALQTALIQSGITDVRLLSLSQGCYFKASANISGYSGNIANGKLDAATPTPVTPVGGGVTGSSDACFSSGWALSWLACPVITAAQTTANSMYGFVEDQLKFTVLQNCSTPNCADSLGKQHDSVHSAWNNFRILVSGLVVILLLVMIISQAIGSGPFDAYTIRKMLPRLVAGVILIQISWPLFSWVVNTVDHLGVGLANIMYAPFGGAKSLDLNTIMKPFIDNVAGGTSVVLFNWVGIGALAVFGVVAPFVVLGMILTVLVAIFVGFLTLLFRKILIILALIFVPVALIAWMMPNDGLRKYWKLWWDNFIKALMMFPLIIVIIAAGRIFAKIGSGQSDFVGFFIVLVGFFGPLFILPKTFKWGGTAMMAAGNALSKAQTASMKKPKEFLGERQKGYKEERRLKSKERVAAGEGFNRRRPWRYPIDKVLSGQWDPTLTGRRAERALATYKKTGRDAYTEDLGAARIGQQIDWEHLVEGGGVVKDDYLQDVLEDKHSIDPNTGMLKEYKTDDGRTLDPRGKSRMEKLAALYEMEKLGGATNNRHILAYWDKVSREAGEHPQAYSDFRRFMSDSVGTMLPKLTDIYKGTVSTADAGPAGIAAQHGSEVENMLATLTNRIKGSTGDEREKHVQTLNTYLRSYLSAAKSDQLRGGMEQGGKRVVKALVTTNEDIQKEILGEESKKNGIHWDPEDGRANLELDNPFILTDSDVVGALDDDVRHELDQIIGRDGNFDEEAIRARAAGGPGTPPAAGGGSEGGTTWRPTGGTSTPI